jgi:hypothetical protein
MVRPRRREMISPAQAQAFVRILLTDSPQMKGYLAAMLPVIPNPDTLAFTRMHSRDERDDLLDLLEQVAVALREKKTYRRPR